MNPLTQSTISRSALALVLFFTAIVLMEKIEASHPPTEAVSPDAPTEVLSSKSLQSTAERKARDIKAAAKRKADQALGSSSQAIQDRIRLLNEQMDHLEAGRTISTSPVAVLSDENMPNPVTH